LEHVIVDRLSHNAIFVRDDGLLAEIERHVLIVFFENILGVALAALRREWLERSSTGLHVFWRGRPFDDGLQIFHQYNCLLINYTSLEVDHSSDQG
jgi:hypothetical protein